MYINFNEEKYDDLIDDIKQTCQSKDIPFPSILNRDISNEYFFPDNEGDELKQFLEYFFEFKSIVKFILDKEQEEVVTYDNHKFLSVEAGPGSGKTRVLVEKVKFMVNELGVKPESILIITFTNKAAEEIQERLIEEGILKSDVQKMQISTIHSFCIKVLEENDNVGYDIFDDVHGEKVNMFVGECLRPLGFFGKCSIEDKHIPYIINKYNEFARFNVNIDGLIKYVEKEMPINPEYINFVNRYEETHKGEFSLKELNKPQYKKFKKDWYNAVYLQIVKSYPTYIYLLEHNHAIDFGQLQIKALKFLEIDNNLKYTNVLIDEFQETTPFEMKIFERLIDNIKSHKDEKTSFTVFGDINQHIYGFIGSTEDYFKYLHDYYEEDFEFMSLPTNYRSTNQIIEISEDFIKHQRDENSALKKPKYGRKENSNVYYMINGDISTEAKNIFEIVKYLKKEGKINKFSEIGILSRSVMGKNFKELLNLFDEYNLENPNDKIPYDIRGLSDLIQKDEIKSILTLMYHLVHDESPHNFFMDSWTLDWLNLKAYSGANFNQILFDLSEDTKRILNDLQDEFEKDVMNLERIIYKEFTGKPSRIRTFRSVFRRDEEILREIFNRIERPFLSNENLKKYGVTNQKDLEFFKKLNKLRYDISSNNGDFFDIPTVSEVYFELLTNITGFITEDNIMLHEEEINNLSSINSIINNFEEIRFERDFKGFYKFIRRTIERHDAYIPQNDGVQIMTVHKSKGLEFPIVILASLRDKRFPITSKSIIPKNRLFYTPSYYFNYKKDSIFNDAEIPYEEEERIIYVAMSRAEDTLILSSIVENGELFSENALEKLDDVEYIKSINKGPKCVQNAIDANLDNGCQLINPNDIKIDTIQRSPKPPKRNFVNLTFQSFDNYLNCPFKYKLSNLLNFNKLQSSTIENSILIHDIFNIINKRIKYNNNKYIGDNEVIKNVNQLLLVKNRDLLLSGGYRKVEADVLHYYNTYGKHIKIIDCEYSFHLKDKHYILDGIIDLIGERDGKLIVVDYKNIFLNFANENLKEKFKMQLHLYVLALRDQNQEYFGRDIDEVGIYSIKSKEVLTFKVDEKLIEKLHEKLNDVALSIKKEEFNSRRCGDCKYCKYSEICNQNV